MKLNTYLIFKGNCKEAFKFYEQVLRGKSMMRMTFGESPMHDQSKPEERDLIMHTSLQFGDQVLMGSDAPSQMPFQPPQGFHISIGVDDVAEAERIYKALSEGGSVQMELQKTFWAERFAMFSDRFGIPWMVNCEAPK
ncbi:MAG: VOC family protein [Burkholderiaceae bacterium]